MKLGEYIDILTRLTIEFRQKGDLEEIGELDKYGQEGSVSVHRKYVRATEVLLEVIKKNRSILEGLPATKTDKLSAEEIRQRPINQEQMRRHIAQVRHDLFHHKDIRGLAGEVFDELTKRISINDFGNHNKPLTDVPTEKAAPTEESSEPAHEVEIQPEKDTEMEVLMARLRAEGKIL